ncbi:MAG: hypothetical protein RIQ29_443 [Pseudomonadota bacterium]
MKQIAEKSSATRTVRMLTRYNRWANELVLKAIAELPSEEVYKKRSAALGGIIFTLAHVDIVDRIWKAHLTGVAHGYNSRTTNTPESLEILTQKLREMADWYIDYADTTNETLLNEVVKFDFVDGGSGEMTRGDILLHVCNNKTFHRGHLGNMFYQLGFRPPSIDLPVYMRDAFNIRQSE